MDLDDLFPSKPDDPLVALAKQDLDPISIEELHERIEALKAEIARVEAHIERARPTARRPKSCSRRAVTGAGAHVLRSAACAIIWGKARPPS